MRQASLRYDCSSPKPISRSVEIARIRSIPAVYRHSERVLQVSETIGQPNVISAISNQELNRGHEPFDG